MSRQNHFFNRLLVEHDFRVGGINKLTFGPQGQIPYTEDCRYEDIVENQRIVYSMTIDSGAERLTASLVTIEFSGAGEATDLVATDQIAILSGGDSAAERERGWGETLGRLTLVLA